MTAEIGIEFTGVGWARIHISVDGKSYDSPSVSYCTDAFGDLARMALSTATGAYRSEASFELEPGELRITLVRQPPVMGASPGSCLLSVLEFRDFMHHPAPPPDSEGVLIFGVEVGARAFGKAMLAALDAVWNEHGVDGFNKRWAGRSGFPLSAMEALRRALEVKDPTPINPDFEEAWAALIDEAAEN
jgi:hypothetical protein